MCEECAAHWWPAMFKSGCRAAFGSWDGASPSSRVKGFVVRAFVYIIVKYIFNLAPEPMPGYRFSVVLIPCAFRAAPGAPASSPALDLRGQSCACPADGEGFGTGVNGFLPNEPILKHGERQNCTTLKMQSGAKTGQSSWSRDGSGRSGINTVPFPIRYRGRYRYRETRGKNTGASCHAGT